MKFLSLEPFIPSGSNYEGSKQFFQELGFTIGWEGGDYIGFEREGCKFILQKYDNSAFAKNLMMNVKVDSAEQLWTLVTKNQLPERFGIGIAEPKVQPYGIEVNLIDMAGVCWHFVE